MKENTSNCIDISCARKPLSWLTNCTNYQPTPLTELAALGEVVGCSAVLVKDETSRMGLGSFKALGGAYAVFRLAEQKLEAVLERMPSLEEVTQLSKSYLNGQTVCCASAGNHGLSVAEGARILGLKCEVFLSEQVPLPFEKRLQQKGAKVIRSGVNYEESMTNALSHSQKDNVTLITDSSWAGETYYPSLVMQGYSVLAKELFDEFTQLGQWPTHVLLQAGVGGMAAAITQYIRDYWPIQPEIIVVEPKSANCLQQSINCGTITCVEGPISNMGRLDCKEPSMLAFNILKASADEFVTVTDQQAEGARQMLHSHGINTTTSGAAGLAYLMHSSFPSTARPLIIVTETQ